MELRAIVLRAPGINRDRDAALACELAGARVDMVHVNRLAAAEVSLRDYQFLIIPGGFSYGDQLGAGRLLAVDLLHRLSEPLQEFVAAGKPVIGICNGFQVLVKSGMLPGPIGQPRGVTLTHNRQERFECRWVQLQAESASRCHFTNGIRMPLEVPVAHGEGRIAVRDDATLTALEQQGLVALRYSADVYPDNPNGSPHAIAGICNMQGNVLGLMPHPENAVLPRQHPRWTREPLRQEGDGLQIFRNALRYAASL